MTLDYKKAWEQLKAETSGDGELPFCRGWVQMKMKQIEEDLRPVCFKCGKPATRADRPGTEHASEIGDVDQWPTQYYCDEHYQFVRGRVGGGPP